MTPGQLPWTPAPGLALAVAPAPDAHAALVALAHERGWGSAASVGHRCPRCGSGEHGRPLLLDAAGRRLAGCWASVARTHGGRGRGEGSPWQQAALVAVSSLGPVGVDVELAGTTPPPADIVRHPDEPAASGIDLLTRWVAKEAVLKALGVGLAREPASVRLADDPSRVSSDPGVRLAVRRLTASGTISGPPANELIAAVAWLEHRG